MALAVEEFLARLSESGVATEEEIQSWIATIPESERPNSGDDLARALVSRRVLTEFQSQTIVEPGEHPLVLGQYVLLDRIGQGGTGTVYRALHRHMQREVAIKLLHSELAESPEALRRFQREMLAGGKLNHPYIVPTLDAAQHGESLFLVMEYVPGTDLATLVNRRGRLSVTDAAKYVIQAAEGLGHAHEQGVVHRDVKPSNLLCDSQGTVRVLDLGLARFGEGHSELTGTGDMMGTVDYMAPEQAVSMRQADTRADVYSLGCTLFFLLTGRPPFGGETVMTRLLAHRDTAAPTLRSVRSDIPESLDQIVQKMLAKDPNERYQTMHEVITALRPFEGWGGWQAIRSRWLTRRSVSAAMVAVALATISMIWIAGTLAPGPAATNPGVIHSPTTLPPPALVPFDATKAVLHQEAWAQYLKVPVEIENTLGMKLRLIPPGEFLQGATSQEIADAAAAKNRNFDSDGPQHRVQLTKAFYFGVYEVTQAEYEAIIGNNPAQYSANGTNAAAVAGLDTRRLPVEMVSWLEAVEFCNRLSARENRQPCYQQSGDEIVVVAGDGYRLPTEAEWEFACRAGTVTPWSCDMESVQRHGWFMDNSGQRPQSVGLLSPNAFQLFDLHGNLWEWCQDYFHPADYAQLADATLVDPAGPNLESLRLAGLASPPRSMRGGVWNDEHWLARSAHRGANHPTIQNGSIGFRIVLSIPN
jgi:serine/threonine-protein kinase